MRGGCPALSDAAQTRDLELMEDAKRRIALLTAQLASAERDLDDVAARVKTVEPTTSKAVVSECCLLCATH